jgi:hypothetical protein
MGLGARMCLALVASIAFLAALTYPVDPTGPGGIDPDGWINRQVAWASANQAIRSLSVALALAIDLAIRGIWALL